MSIIHDALKKVEKEKKDASTPVPDEEMEVPKEPSVSGGGRRWPFHLFSFGRSLVGIDIGFSSVKAVCLERGASAYTLKSVGYAAIPAGASEGGVIDALKSVVRRQNLTGRMVSSTINPASLTISQVMLPKMPGGDLAKAVTREVKKNIDFPDDAVIDYIVNDEVEEGGKKKLSIIGFAVKRSEISKSVDMLKEASLKPSVIDVCPLAFLSAFDCNYGWEPGKRYAVIDIGASKTILTILSNNTLRLTRTIPLAGNDITWSIQDAEQTDFKSAEEMKIQHSHSMGSAPETVKAAIEAFVNDIAGEIRRSFIYYQAQLREGPVDKMLVSGGCARIEGLVEHLGENVGIPAALYDPYRGLKLTEGLHESTDLESLSPLIAGALGLALRRRLK